jgi:phosphomannomutase
LSQAIIDTKRPPKREEKKSSQFNRRKTSNQTWWTESGELKTRKGARRSYRSREKELDILDWVEAKAPNPYEWYHKYIEEIEKLISNTNIAKKDIVILMSAGPASKPLARYFSMQGVQSIDMGHGFQYLGNLEELEKQVI